MSSTTWTTTAVASERRPWKGRAWRMVEAQHIASTMKLVDTAAEQGLLEALIDTSKPRPPAGTAHLHYLLATPFRYSPRRGGSRFRDRDDPGVFYAAQGVRDPYRRFTRDELRCVVHQRRLADARVSAQQEQ